MNSPYVYTWVAHGDMAINVRISDPVSVPFDSGPRAEWTRITVDKIVDMLRQYTPTPVDKIPVLPLDTDGILSRTLPTENGSEYSGVYPAQAYLHTVWEPSSESAALTDAGVDYVAIDNSDVYRTTDNAAARRLMAAVMATKDGKYVAEASPPDLPTARCLAPKEDPHDYATENHLCYVVFDRYLAEVGSPNQQDLYQMTSAQYKLLTYGH